MRSSAVTPTASPKWYARSTDGPRDLDVMILDGQTRQALACVRAYYAAGLRVGAAACAQEARDAAALHSRRAAIRTELPDFESNPDGYVDALLALLDAHPAKMVLPCHDGSIEALRARRADVERKTVLPIASDAALDIAVSKARTLALAQELGIAIPRGVPISGLDDLPRADREIGYPAVVKPVQSWVECDGTGTRLTSDVVINEAEARRHIEYIVRAGGEAVFQEWLPGQREAVTLFYAKGRHWARFAQVSHREWPTLGGVSVLCESIPLLPEIVQPAERLVETIGLEGCSMVEFRRDRQGRPVLMEINARMGGSVQLALLAGVNFPTLLHAWAMETPLWETSSYRVGRRLRWLGGDIWNLKSVFHSHGRPDVPQISQAVPTFLTDFILRPSALDFVDLHDMRPALVEFRSTVGRHALHRMRKFIPLSRIPQG